MSLRFDDVLMAAFMGGFNFAEKESGYFEELESSQIAEGFREWRSQLAEGMGTEEAPISRPEYPVEDEPAEDARGIEAVSWPPPPNCCLKAQETEYFHSPYCSED